MTLQDPLKFQYRDLLVDPWTDRNSEAVLYVSICAISSVSSLQNFFSIRSMQTMAKETFDEPVEGWIA